MKNPPYPDRDILHTWGLSPKKSLGQNFLLLPEVVEKMVVPFESTMDPIYEIGPGPGALTWALYHFTKAPLTLIEKDSQFYPILERLQKEDSNRITLLPSDFFHIKDFPKHYFVTGNLPYNVATEMIFKLLTQDHPPQHMVFMVQLEVAERLYAKPGSKDYGRLSVMVQWLAKAWRQQVVPSEAFWPAPKVTSAVVEIVPHPTRKPLALQKAMSQILAQAFGHRRKMIRASLKKVFPDLEATFQAANLTGTERPEDLSVQTFEDLAKIYQKQVKA